MSILAIIVAIVFAYLAFRFVKGVIKFGLLALSHRRSVVLVDANTALDGARRAALMKNFVRAETRRRGGECVRHRSLRDLSAFSASPRDKILIPAFAGMTGRVQF